MAAAWDLGIRYFDTAPLYDLGDGERRMAQALRDRPRDGYVLSTKVGRLVTPRGIEHDYSHDGALRSIEDSLRRERVLGAIGVGVNSWRVCQDAAEAADFDCFLLAGRYTLLEQEALASFLPLCERRGISVIVGARYNTGILARGAVPGAQHGYTEPSVEIAERVRRLEGACARHGVSLGAAALQFPLAHPAVAAVLPGPRSAAQVEASVRWLGETIPGEFWQELKSLRLLDVGAPTPERVALRFAHCHRLSHSLTRFGLLNRSLPGMLVRRRNLVGLCGGDNHERRASTTFAFPGRASKCR